MSADSDWQVAVDEALYDLRQFKIFVDGWMAHAAMRVGALDGRLDGLEARLGRLEAVLDAELAQWDDPTPTDAVKS